MSEWGQCELCHRALQAGAPRYKILVDRFYPDQRTRHGQENVAEVNACQQCAAEITDSIYRKAHA